MVNASIKYLGGIESGDYSSPEYVTLTGSSTLVKFESDLKNVSVLIDYGMFQGGKADDEYNEKIDNDALKADFMVLTHAHLDHCGRIPFLVKNGFSNPIYMTKLTALQAEQILLDSVKVAKRKIEEITDQNEKKEAIMKYNLFIVDAYDKLKGKISKEDRNKINASIAKKIGSEVTLEDAYKKAKKFCDDNNIFSQDDINKNLLKVPVLLYDDMDVYNMLSLVHLLDIGEEEVLNDFFYIDTYNKKTLDYILDKVSLGYNEEILMDNKVFNKIKEEISERIEKTKEVLRENQLIKKENDKLAERLEESLNFVLHVNEEQSRELYKEHSKFLKKYEVEVYSDIDDALEKPYKVKYNLELLQKISKLLKIKVKTNDEKNKKIIDSIKLNFIDAGHIEGSVQALITVVTENVNTALKNKKKSNGFDKKTKKHTNFLFSGDIGKLNDPNLSGKPDISELKLDYAQYETTYAGRLHPDRAETEREFLDELSKAERKVLIPTFSMQRTQEILMLLLEDMYNHKGDKDELEKLKVELKEFSDEYDLIENKDSIKARQLFRTIEILKDDIKIIKKSSFFFNIVLDSPLSEKITNIYLNNLGDKYNLLNPEVQEKLFGREVITYIRNKKEQEEIYKGKRAYKKEIIVSSSGMCEGGAVVSHLENNLENPKSTLVFVGYTPPNSRGGKIKAKEDVVIESDTYKVLCNVIDKKCSAHGDQADLLKLISKSSINRGATVALTHGTESRYALSEKIRKEVFKTRKSIDILVPNLGDTIEIKI